MRLLALATLCGMNQILMFSRGARKLMGENLKVVLDEFSTLSWAVLYNAYTSWPIQTRPSLELKNQLRFCPVSLSLSIVLSNQL